MYKCLGAAQSAAPALAPAAGNRMLVGLKVPVPVAAALQVMCVRKLSSLRECGSRGEQADQLLVVGKFYDTNCWFRSRIFSKF